MLLFIFSWILCLLFLLLLFTVVYLCFCWCFFLFCFFFHHGKSPINPPFGMSFYFFPASLPANPSCWCQQLPFCCFKLGRIFQVSKLLMLNVNQQKRTGKKVKQYMPGTNLSSIFSLGPSKTRSFSTKTRVIWFLGGCLFHEIVLHFRAFFFFPRKPKNILTKQTR